MVCVVPLGASNIFSMIQWWFEISDVGVLVAFVEWALGCPVGVTLPRLVGVPFRLLIDEVVALVPVLDVVGLDCTLVPAFDVALVAAFVVPVVLVSDVDVVDLAAVLELEVVGTVVESLVAVVLVPALGFGTLAARVTLLGFLLQSPRNLHFLKSRVIRTVVTLTYKV